MLVAAPAWSQSLDNLKNDGKNTDNVLTYGMGYHQQRYSTLEQINKGTSGAWCRCGTLRSATSYGEQAQPIVYNGVMYVANVKRDGRDRHRTGRQIWTHAGRMGPAVPRVVCCGLSNKGVAVFDGKVYRATLDAHLVALDQKTGKQVWKSKVAEWKEGYSITGRAARSPTAW